MLFKLTIFLGTMYHSLSSFLFQPTHNISKDIHETQVEIASRICYIYGGDNSISFFVHKFKGMSTTYYALHKKGEVDNFELSYIFVKRF